MYRPHIHLKSNLVTTVVTGKKTAPSTYFTNEDVDEDLEVKVPNFKHGDERIFQALFTQSSQEYMKLYVKFLNFSKSTILDNTSYWYYFVLPIKKIITEHAAEREILLTNLLDNYYKRDDVKEFINVLCNDEIDLFDNILGLSLALESFIFNPELYHVLFALMREKALYQAESYVRKYNFVDHNIVNVADLDFTQLLSILYRTNCVTIDDNSISMEPNLYLLNYVDFSFRDEVRDLVSIFQFTNAIAVKYYVAQCVFLHINPLQESSGFLFYGLAFTYMLPSIDNHSKLKYIQYTCTFADIAFYIAINDYYQYTNDKITLRDPVNLSEFINNRESYLSYVLQSNKLKADYDLYCFRYLQEQLVDQFQLDELIHNLYRANFLIGELYLDSIDKYSFLCLLFNFLTSFSDEKLQELGYLRYGMSLHNMLDINYLVTKGQYTWIAVDKSFAINRAVNANYKTLAALNAQEFLDNNVLTDDERQVYEELASETYKDSWQYGNNIFLAIGKEQQPFVYTINGLISATDRDEVMIKINLHDNFSRNEIDNLRHAIYNYYLYQDNSVRLFKICNKIIEGSPERNINKFREFYSNLQGEQKLLIKSYFAFYFWIQNYMRFWIGPGYKIVNVSNPTLQLYVRIKLVNMFLRPTLYRLQKDIATFAGENWDRDLYLMSNYNEPIPQNSGDIFSEQPNNTLIGRIELVLQGELCAAIFCQRANLYFNSILSYTGMVDEETISDVDNYKQQLSNLFEETYLVISKYLQEENYYRKALIKQSDELLIYNKVAALYEYISENLQQEQAGYNYFLLAPLFITVDKCANVIIRKIKVKGYTLYKLVVKEDDIRELLAKFNIKIDKDINEICADLYDYYLQVAMYAILEKFTTAPKQEIASLSLYNNMYHTLPEQDEGSFTTYVTLI
jgi:hypothetical protein